MTVNQLKKSWTTAAEKARSNCSMSPICVKATIVLVTEVPMFAPITIGMAYLEYENKSTQIFPYVCNANTTFCLSPNKNWIYLLNFYNTGSNKPDNY